MVRLAFLVGLASCSPPVTTFIGDVVHREALVALTMGTLEDPAEGTSDEVVWFAIVDLEASQSLSTPILMARLRDEGFSSEWNGYSLDGSIASGEATGTITYPNGEKLPFRARGSRRGGLFISDDDCSVAILDDGSRVGAASICNEQWERRAADPISLDWEHARAEDATLHRIPHMGFEAR